MAGEHAQAPIRAVRLRQPQRKCLTVEQRLQRESQSCEFTQAAQRLPQRRLA
jgi:hypothetical protein